MENKDTLQGKWKEFKGEVMSTWGKLTDDELDQARGNVQSLGGIIQQKYGTAKEQISGELDKLFSRYGRTFNEKAEDVKENLKSSKPKV